MNQWAADGEVAVDNWAVGESWIDLPGIIPLLEDGVMKVRSRTAFFDLQSFDCGRVTGEGDTLKEVLRCLELLREAMLPGTVAGSAPWKPRIAVAGSAALCLVERLLSQDPKGRWRGRWKKRARGAGGNLIWNPNDVDVFFCGRVGSRKASFRAAVRGICDRLSRQLAAEGLKLIEGEEHENRYTARPEPFLIRNVNIEGMETAVSFIQVPECEDVAELMEGFDMDIVRCLCNIEKEEVCVPVKVVSQIWKGEVAVVDFVTKQSFPSEVEEKVICSTLRRMRKYGRRGYKCKRYSQIMSREEASARRSRARAQRLQEVGESGAREGSVREG
jgi:hypothetical protein